ncbi:MAG: HD domain-containing protein, partial [Acidobacteriota bacterium]|nr:HD domain-containing protein [Acidobacteriota bacterium]
IEFFQSFFPATFFRPRPSSTMMPTHPAFSDELAYQCTQELYRCLEEMGSTKGVLYLRVPKGHEDAGSFWNVSEYGWPRGSHAPTSIPPNDPLLVWIQREKRAFAVNETAEFPELKPFSEGSDAPRFLLAPIYLKGDWVGLLVQRDRTKGVPYDMEHDEKPTLRICNDVVDVLTRFRPFTEPAALPPSATMPMKTISPLPGAGLIPEVPDSKAGAGPQAAVPARRIQSGARAPKREGYSQLPWGHETNTGIPLSPQPEPPEAGSPLGGTTAASMAADAQDEELAESKRRSMPSQEQKAFFWQTASLLFQLMPLDVAALWMQEAEKLRPLLAYSDRPLSRELQRQLLAQASNHLPDIKKEDLRILLHPEKREVTPLAGTFAMCAPFPLGVIDEAGDRSGDLLLLFRRPAQPFTEPELALIRQVGGLLNLHLEEGRLHERYHRAFLSVSHRILKSSEGRSPKMKEHGLTCAKLSRGVALRMDLPTVEVEAISIAAILHDVGSLLLDPELMIKPELSAAELAKARTHPVLAAAFLKDLRFPFDVLKIIRHHHERWDGQGYPDGLSGEGIPVGSRIIGLVEAFDVMTTGKGYKAPKALAKVLEEIRSEAGRQFDPKAVEALVWVVGKAK